MAECSNQGKCNRTTGICECFAPYEGVSCNVITCPTSIPGKECSGHGSCQNISDIQMKLIDNHQLLRSCMCSSSWEVGIEPNQIQFREYFAPDCSLSTYISL